MRYILLVLSLCAYGQTTAIDPSQVRAANTGKITLFGFDETGEPKLFTLGSGVAIVNGVISAQPGQMAFALKLTEIEVPVGIDGVTYAQQQGAGWFTLNGVHMFPGKDYGINQGRIDPIKPWPATSQLVWHQILIVPVVPPIVP